MTLYGLMRPIVRPANKFARYMSVKKQVGDDKKQSASKQSKPSALSSQQQQQQDLKLNLPNAGDFQLSMKNICQIEERIKKVRHV